MKKITIGVIGYGFVGKACAQGFLQSGGVDVLVHDPYVNVGEVELYNHNKHSTSSLKSSTLEEMIINPDVHIVFVCVPTPMFEDGSSDISIVKDVVCNINKISKKYDHLNKVSVVIKSTVIPGTTKRLNKECSFIEVAFNPEFLREATYMEDFMEQDRIVFGCEDKATHKRLTNLYYNFVDSRELKKEVEPAYRRVNPYALMHTFNDPTQAEMVKYVANCFMATKISFANEMYQICKKLDIDYDEVIEVATLDERLGPQYGWKVPGPILVDGKLALGYGLSCIPGSTLIDLGGGRSTAIKNLLHLHWWYDGEHPLSGVQDKKHLYIKSFNTQITDVESKEIKNVTARLHDGLLYTFTIEINGIERSLSCTPEHIMPVYRDGKLLLVMAKDVTDNDELYYV